MKPWILGGLVVMAALAACSNEVKIKAETTGSTSSGSTSSGTTNTQGSGGASTTSSGGTGGAGASGPGKVLTAETDVAQYQAVATSNTDAYPVDTKLLDGPFFISDVLFSGASLVTTVYGADCSVSFDKHTVVLSTKDAGSQVHGMRLPILPGQSLCTQSGINARVTVLGFRPY